MSKKNICNREETVVAPKDLPDFEIKLINKFDEDPRNIRVWYNGKPTTLYHLDSDNPDKKKRQEQRQEQKQEQKQKQKDCIDHKQHGQEKPYDEETFSLKPDETLTVELAEEEGDFKNFTKDLFFELPFIADYKLSFELRTGDSITPVDRPVTYITRDTTPNQKISTEEGKTVVRIPGDQRAWRLDIMSPRNMKEHCHLKNVLAKHLEMSNGTKDSGSVGDNGPG